MSSNYWAQWDKSDLDSWQGKDIEYNDDDVDFDEENEKTNPDDEESGCSCGHYCFDCLGISWHDFM